MFFDVVDEFSHHAGAYLDVPDAVAMAMAKSILRLADMIERSEV